MLQICELPPAVRYRRSLPVGRPAGAIRGIRSLRGAALERNGPDAVDALVVGQVGQADREGDGLAVGRKLGSPMRWIFSSAAASNGFFWANREQGRERGRATPDCAYGNYLAQGLSRSEINFPIGPSPPRP